eukprot:m.97794 g.97794  ORF g.97794 m.97794 type:complete len:463 (+) comp12504_c0_seq1:270-1658(+)
MIGLSFWVVFAFIGGSLVGMVGLLLFLYNMNDRRHGGLNRDDEVGDYKNGVDFNVLNGEDATSLHFNKHSRNEIMAKILVELDESNGVQVNNNSVSENEDRKKTKQVPTSVAATKTTSRKKMNMRDLKDLYLRLVLSNEEAQNYICDLSPSYVLPNLVGYNPSSPELDAFKLFAPIKKNTHCVFAKRARVWCAHNKFTLHISQPLSSIDLVASQKTAVSSINHGVSMSRDGDEGWRMTLAAFTLFSSCRHDVDGFLFHLPAGNTLEEHGDNVNTLLRQISDCDKASSKNCMDDLGVDKAGWSFVFANKDFFVTSFSPCYPSNSSRYQFGVNDASFVFFQPSSSFLLHGLGNDTPKSATQWQRPMTNRDKTRCAFWKHDREYFIPEVPALTPLVHQIVSPLSPHTKALSWWKKNTRARTMKYTLEEIEKQQLQQSGMAMHLHHASLDSKEKSATIETDEKKKQ